MIAPAVVLGLAVGSTLMPLPASADPAPASGLTAFTQTTPGAFSGTVPDGACEVQTVSQGGGGASAIGGGGTFIPGGGGGGAVIRASYPVVPGQTFSGTVGGGAPVAARAGGAPGGGDGGAPGIGHRGGGGGGFTTLSIGGQELVVAGGGGGAGGGHNTTQGRGGDAGLLFGPGIAAGSDGGDGVQAAASGATRGGKGGGTGSPGAGGVNDAAAYNGFPGVGRTGGNGGADTTPDTGGGGGAGFFGGGGGASTDGNGSGVPTSTGIGGSGGGGGSSFVNSASPTNVGGVFAVSSQVGPKGTSTTAAENGADGLVGLSWVPCNYDLSVAKSVTPQNPQVGSTVTWTVTVSNSGTVPMTRGDTVTLTDTLPGSGATKVTGVTVSGGSNNLGLTRPAVTCDVASGDAMKGTVTCERPYGDSTDSSPDTGFRGIDPGESITITYTQVVTAVGALSNTATVTDRAGTTNAATATATGQAVPPTTAPDTTQGPQGAVQTVDPLLNDTPAQGTTFDPSTLILIGGSNQPRTSVTISGQGTYTIDRSDTAHPRLVFTPLPTFTATATPVTYRISDADRGSATSTYTPTVRPNARPDTSTGPQGVAQSVDPLTNDTADQTVTLVPSSLRLVDPATGNPTTSPVTITNQGTYSISNGRIVFTPVRTFTGTPTPVAYQVTDTAGNVEQSTYTPSVTAVKPVAEPDSTEGPQGVAQSVAPLDNDTPGDANVPLDPTSLTLLDGSGAAVDTLVGPNGTYTLDRSDTAHPRIVFTPDKTSEKRLI